MNAEKKEATKKMSHKLGHKRTSLNAKIISLKFPKYI